jgi:hypothetical protein
MSNGTGRVNPRITAILKNAAIIVGVLSAVAYGVLRIAYVQYYQEFRVLPEQAGLGKTELLTQALVGPVVLLALLSLLVLAGIFVVAFLGRSKNKTEGLLERSKRLARDHFWRALEWCLAISVSVLVVALIWFANDSADKAIQGRESLLGRYVGWGPFTIPLLDVRALPTNVEWRGGGDTPSAITSAGPCMMYLGETADTVLLYDAKVGQTIMVSKPDVIVELRTHSSGLPEIECPPPPETSERG